MVATGDRASVAMGDRGTPESCRTVCEVAMLGEGRRESGKKEVVNDKEREGRKVKVVNREGKSGRSGVRRRERNYKEKVNKQNQ